jgi:hypothetical protein
METAVIDNESWDLTDRRSPMKKGVPKEVVGKVSVNGIDRFFARVQDAAWRASCEWNIRERAIT